MCVCVHVLKKSRRPAHCYNIVIYSCCYFALLYHPRERRVFNPRHTMRFSTSKLHSLFLSLFNIAASVIDLARSFYFFIYTITRFLHFFPILYVIGLL